LADSKAKVLEAFENKQRSEAEYDSLLERLKAQYREAGVPEDEVTARLPKCCMSSGNPSA